MCAARNVPSDSKFTHISLQFLEVVKRKYRIFRAFVWGQNLYSQSYDC